MSGDYVNIKVGYKDQARKNNSSYDYTTASNISKAWRVTKKEGGNVYLTSTGFPLAFHAIDSKFEYKDVNILNPMRTISGTLKTSGSVSYYSGNGFSSNTPSALFPSVCIELSVPANREFYHTSLRAIGYYDYCLCACGGGTGAICYVKSTDPNNNHTNRGGDFFVRPSIKLDAKASVRDGSGSASNPYRLNEITY